MTERNRQFLKQEFKDGERPNGNDFSDLLDSFMNIEDDGLSLDADNNLIISRGIQLGNSNSTTPGTLRFNGVNVEFFDGTAWSELGGGGSSVFLPSGTAGEVNYASGNVGIGVFATSPTYSLDVVLGEDTGTEARVRFGNVVCSNGSGAAAADAFFYHQNLDSSSRYALRQRASGELRINSPTGERIRFVHDGNVPRMTITGGGNVIIRGNSDLVGSGGAEFQVNGSAFKNNGTDTWDNTSDMRVKKDIRDLELGLDEIKKIRPVRYRFTGEAGTPKNLDGIGILGQEIEKIIPETVKKISSSQGLNESEIEDLRVYNSSALTYVLINSVKELANIVDKQSEQITTLLKENKNESNC